MRRRDVIKGIAASVSWPIGARAQEPDLRTCEYSSGDVAIDACTRVINSSSSSKDKVAFAYLSRGVEFHRKGEEDKAIADTTRAMQLGLSQQDTIYAYEALCSSYFAKGDYSRAIANCTQALKLDPQFPGALAQRGAAREKIGDVPGALADYRAALSLPQKYSDGKWARDLASRRIEELTKR